MTIMLLPSTLGYFHCEVNMKKYCIINKGTQEIICVKSKGWKAYSREYVFPTKNYYKVKIEQSPTEVILKLNKLQAEYICHLVNKEFYSGWTVEERA